MYVFISYAGNDGLRYAKILERILSSSHKTFLFEKDHSIQHGLYSQLGEALYSCRIVAIIITQSSHTSKEQEKEYNVACSFDKGVGIIKENIEWGKFSMLTSREYKRFNDDNVEEKMNSFLETINKLPEKVEASVADEGSEIV